MHQILAEIDGQSVQCENVVAAAAYCERHQIMDPKYLAGLTDADCQALPKQLGTPNIATAEAAAEHAALQDALNRSLLEMALSQSLQDIAENDWPQPVISYVPVDVREQLADLYMPSKLRALLLNLGQRHPELVRDIIWTAGSTPKAQYVQACLHEGGEDQAGKDRRKELWSLLSVRDQSDLLNAFELVDGDRDTFFLKIAEEDRRVRAKTG